MRDLNHTISVLSKAYLTGYFIPMKACCCVIGNIIADSCDYNITGISKISYTWENDKSEYVYTAWPDVICFGEIRSNLQDRGYLKGLIEIESTGYSAEELASLEIAMFRGMSEFLIDDEIDEDGDWQGPYRKFYDREFTFTGRNIPTEDEVYFHGLMAVVDRLFEVHEVEDQAHKEEAKNQFVKV